MLAKYEAKTPETLCFVATVLDFVQLRTHNLGMDTQKPLGSGFKDTTTAREITAGRDLTGKTVLITGGHSGIGLENTKRLSEIGAKVHVGARDIAKANEVLRGIKNVTVDQLDLANPKSIDTFAANFLKTNPKLDILINNAGIMATPFEKDARGFESQFATNHLGHFQLTQKLWPALKAAGKARVIVLTSAGHRFSQMDFEDPNFEHRPYEKWVAYGQSKTANALFAKELDARGKADGIRAFSVHPGRIPGTSLLRYMSPEEIAAATKPGAGDILHKTIEQGAATTLWAALSEKLDRLGGLYCADCDVGQKVSEYPNTSFFVLDYAVDSDLAKRLWTLTEKMLSQTQT